MMDNKHYFVKTKNSFKKVLQILKYFYYLEILLYWRSKRIIFRLNIYDTKPLACKDCGKIIGEIDYDAEVILPKCSQCSNPTPHINDKIPYLIKH